ncbi:DUF2971 domain-containing protein [Aquibacillus albus]|uniref:DUF2971 domain-containing protein n=1 Tax=Aquibacillus albus TaxID=1168171 RepID=UPI00195809F5
MANLIGPYQELEKQQIYFAALEELNDPMEGMRRYYFRGDRVVWENFFKHYLLCLEHVLLVSRVLPEDEAIKKEDVPVFKSQRDLPTDMYQERIENINDSFFSNRFVQSYLKVLIENPNKIYMEEMYVHLKILSFEAIQAILEVDVQNGLFTYPENKRFDRKDIALDLDFPEPSELYSDGEAYRELMDTLYDLVKAWDNELLFKLKDSPKQQSIQIEFPQMYLDSIVKLTYPEAFVACFMDNCSNSAIWGTYGVNHTGVCLKYNSDDKVNPALPLKTITGYSSNGFHHEYRQLPLRPIDYSSEFEDFDFFQNIGRLPQWQLIEQWYTDKKGKKSVCGEKFFDDIDQWRKDYWNRYEKAFLKKLPEWSHEREYRIILSSALNTYSIKNNRLLEYKFEDLEAIIFGIRTPKEARTEIMEIVKRKCGETGREHFKFYEMAYSTSTGKLYQRKLNFLG